MNKWERGDRLTKGGAEIGEQMFYGLKAINDNDHGLLPKHT
jgi:hypothetical protein